VPHRDQAITKPIETLARRDVALLDDEEREILREISARQEKA